MEKIKFEVLVGIEDVQEDITGSFDDLESARKCYEEAIAKETEDIKYWCISEHQNVIVELQKTIYDEDDNFVDLEVIETERINK